MRLIDADTLFAEIKGRHDMFADCEYIGDKARRDELSSFMADIVNAPTIGGWISVEDRLPEEHESIFHKFLGTSKWSSAMWQQESDKVLVCVSLPDGTSVVTTGCLHNSDWMTTVSKQLPQTVTHWMPLPEMPEEEKKHHDRD